jgi:hypothetical protein
MTHLTSSSIEKTT